MRKKIIFIENPSPQIFLENFRKELGKNNVLIIVGECRIEYRGRASSELGYGERLIIIKKDKSIIVHRPTGYEPVNWQPSQCFYKTRIVDSEILIEAIRQRPFEILKIFFKKVFIMISAYIIDESIFKLYGDEEDMRQALVLNPQLIEDNFKVIEIEKEIDGNYVDIYGIDKDAKPTLIEIKKNTAGKNAVLQLYKYMMLYRKKYGRNVRGIIVAPKLKINALKLAKNLGIEFKRFNAKLAKKYLSK